MTELPEPAPSPGAAPSNPPSAAPIAGARPLRQPIRYAKAGGDDPAAATAGGHSRPLAAGMPSSGRELRTIARRRWRWLVLGPAAALALTAILLAWTPRWYAAHALLRIADWRDASATQGSDAAAAATLAAAQLTASPQVIAPVVRRLRLAQAPEYRPRQRFWARAAAVAAGPAAQTRITETVLGRLQVQPHARSDLLDLSYRDHDPALAAGILRGIAAELGARMQARAGQAMRRQQAFLTAQLAAVNRQWQAAAQALVAFRAGHPADAAGPRQSAAMARLMTLSQALTEAEIDLWRQRAVVRAGSRPGGARVDAGTQQRLANLRLRRAELAAQESRLAAQYGPAALPLVQARRALASVQLSLNRYRRALLSGHRVSARADRWEREQLEAAVTREGALLAAAEQNAIQDRVLAAKLRARQDLYEQLWQRHRQLSIARGLVQDPVQVLAPPLAPARPVSAHGALLLAAAALFGGLAGLGLALGIEAVAPRLRRENAAALGLPVLGRLRSAASAGWERALDDLWVTLIMAAGTETTYVLTSSEAGTGKTFVALALAARLSEAGHSVLLMDCHFQAPKLTVTSAAQPTPGLAEYLDGRCPLEALLRNAMAAAGPAVLPAGAWRKDLAGALASPAFTRLLTQLARRFDWVFLDAGPVETQAEVRLLARAADAVLFVAADGETPLASAQQAVASLRRGAAKKLALILNAPAAAGDSRTAPAARAATQAAAQAAG